MVEGGSPYCVARGLRRYCGRKVCNGSSLGRCRIHAVQQAVRVVVADDRGRGRALAKFDGPGVRAVGAVDYLVDAKHPGDRVDPLRSVAGSLDKEVRIDGAQATAPY